jgi:hypothetical protein
MTYTVTTGEPTTLDMGHRTTAWTLCPAVVFGGWAVIWTRWSEDRHGWDLENRPTDGLVYDSKEEAEVAMRGAA